MIVVSDTSPLNYLVLIERENVLRELFGRVIIPLSIIGTIGVLDQAARRNLIDLRNAFDELQKTNFHISEDLIRKLLKDNED